MELDSGTRPPAPFDALHARLCLLYQRIRAFPHAVPSERFQDPDCRESDLLKIRSSADTCRQGRQRRQLQGGGTFGLSTAWHLVRNGYTHVTVLDRHDLPSQDSAGFDLNKIFRTEYASPLFSRLSHEARAAWLAEEVLEGCYHETGYIFAVKGKSQKRYAWSNQMQMQSASLMSGQVLTTGRRLWTIRSSKVSSSTSLKSQKTSERKRQCLLDP